MSEVQKQNDTYEKLALCSDHSPEEIAVIKNTVAKGTTNTELAYFLFVCRSQKLNPLNKEVWCYKDHRNNLIILAGRDGMLAKAQKHPRWNGIRSAVVCENDEFTIDVANNVIKHEHAWKEPGRIIGAYAIVFLKDGEPTIVWVRMKEYDKGFAVWKSNPSDMIKKTAESKALKLAFGFSGIQPATEFREVDGKVEAIPEAEVLSTEEAAAEEEVSRVVQWIQKQTDWGIVQEAITPEELQNPIILEAYNQKQAECSK